MTDPKRWVDDPEAPGGALRLLGALRAPEPFTNVSEASIRSRLASTLVNAPPAAAAASKLTPFKIAAASGVVIGASVLGYFAWHERSEPSSAPRALPSVVAAAPAASPPPPETAAPAVVPPVETERRDELPKSVGVPRSSTRGDSLAFEESLLERARKASDSSPASALALLREHERRFPAGELTAERLFLMAKASAKAGNEKAARRYGRELERRFPKSAYLPELRAQLPGSF